MWHALLLITFLVFWFLAQLVALWKDIIFFFFSVLFIQMWIILIVVIIVIIAAIVSKCTCKYIEWG